MHRAIACLALLVAGCGPGRSPADGESVAAATDGATGTGAVAVIAMEGETHVLPAINWEVSSVTEAAGAIRFHLVAEDVPVELNLVLARSGMPAAFPATFELPAANQGRVKIDLNFFNLERAGRRTQRRILFNRGTIEIRALTGNHLEMHFSGSGHPLTAHDQFPIEGFVNITY